jgi:ATP-binding protein involved in chromosome partitioning
MTLDEKIRQALQQIKVSGLDRGLLDLVEGADISGSTVRLRMRFMPAYASKSQMREWAESKLKAIPEIEAVEVEFVQAASRQAQSAQATMPHAPTARVPLPRIKNLIAVFSGKGGVGKSTVSTNLAAALGALGQRVGLFDADVHGPNIPTLMGVHEKPEVMDGKMIPFERHRVKTMSIGLLVESDEPLIWRGPMITKAINELLEMTDWGELDFLILDLPPGTGDAQLGLAQDVMLTGSIAVTTPQEVALADVRRGISAFKRLQVPIIGLIENMSYYICPSCGRKEYIFGRGGGEAEAKKQNIPLLGQIPLDPQVREQGDAGVPIIVRFPGSAAAKEFLRIAEKLIAQ